MGGQVNKMWCLTGEHSVKIRDHHEDRVTLFQRAFESVEKAKDYATEHYRKHTGINFAHVFWRGNNNLGSASPNIVVEEYLYMLDPVEVTRWPL